MTEPAEDVGALRKRHAALEAEAQRLRAETVLAARRFDALRGGRWVRIGEELRRAVRQPWRAVALPIIVGRIAVSRPTAERTLAGRLAELDPRWLPDLPWSPEPLAPASERKRRALPGALSGDRRARGVGRSPARPGSSRMSEPGRVRPALSERSIERVEGPDSVDAEAAAIEMANDALATEIATLRRRLFRINRHINAIHSGRWSSLGAAIRAARTPARTFVLPLRIARILLSRPESVTTPILDEALPTPVARRAATAPDQVRAREPGILRRFTSRAASPARGWHESLLQRGLDGLRALESEWIGASEATPIVLTCYPYTRDNPYQSMLYARCREHGIAPIGITDLAVLADTPGLVGLGADVWCHLHWTQSVLAAAGRRFDARRRLRTFVERLDRFKAQGGHLAWTVHNVLPHEHRFDDLEAGLCQAIADRADLIHVLCPETPSITEPWYRLPAEKVRAIPLASYLGVYPNSISQAQARSDLGLSPHHTVLAFVGSIRPYKNVDGLLDAFAKVAATRPHYRLIVAGAPRALKDVDGLRRRLAAHPQVLVKMERIADADVQRYLNACDVAVLPYRDILNSAALTLALAFGRPVIAPARGCVAGIVTDHVGLLFDPGARDGLAAAIARAEELRDPRYREAALAKARELEPGAIADRFARTLRSVAAAVQRRASGGSLGRPLP